MLIRNSYLERVKSFAGLDVIKVITGMRRSGKSVLLGQIRDEIVKRADPDGEIVFFNFEEEENARFLRKGVLHEYVLNIMNRASGRKVYVFLDEVHNMEDWEITAPRRSFR